MFKNKVLCSCNRCRTSLNTVYIEENVGGGLYVSQSLQRYTQVWLKRIDNIHVQDDVVHGYVVRFTKPRTYASDVEHTSLNQLR